MISPDSLTLEALRERVFTAIPTQERLERLWSLAAPYLVTRSNDRHTLYCVAFANVLADLYPVANRDIVLAAMVLHDVGWSTVPGDKLLQSFGPNTLYPELRRQHEEAGARIASALLLACGYDETQIAAITSIIDGHDTRATSHSLEDAIVRDADKLWRYTPFGLAMLSEWFGHSHAEQLRLLEEWTATRFFTIEGRAMARGLLASLQLSLGAPAPEVTPVGQAPEDRGLP